METEAWPIPDVQSDAIGGPWSPNSASVSGFFDRFYFNMHGSEATPFLMVGGGHYPTAGVADGYLIAVVDGEQRNLRFSRDSVAVDEFVGPDASRVIGPLQWRVIAPHLHWSVKVGPNESGIEMDVNWRARSAVWQTDPIVLHHPSVGTTKFEHYFQSGRYEGEVRIDGSTIDVSGWLGQRDRSQGVRPLSGGQGLHLWIQAQLPRHTISLMLDLDRNNQMTMLDGAVLPDGGTGQRIVAVEHDLSFTTDLEFVGGAFAVETDSGESFDLRVDGSAGGGFLSGGGYGGWHGTPRGCISEGERWRLDGSVTPRTLDTPLTDRPAVFDSPVGAGIGVFEFAHTRSPSYSYRPGRHIVGEPR